MDDRSADRIKALVGEKDLRYFSENSLGGLLEEAGIGRDAADIGEAVRLLVECDVYAFVGAVSSGLREIAADDDEFAALVSGIADKVRYDLAQGPVVRSLIEIGKADPRTGVALAARLVRLGDADYAAYLAGGARAGAARECDDLAGSLLSSDEPLHIAAGLRLLRVAHIEHGEPGARIILDAVRTALRRASGDERVDCDALELLLDAYGACPERTGPMIEDLALRRPVCRPILASRVANRPPFGSDMGLRCLDICASGLDGGSADANVHYVCHALAGLASEQPEGATKLILGMIKSRAYADKHGGRVLEELGRVRASAVSRAVLEMLRGPHGSKMGRHLPFVIRRLGRHADMQEAAGPFLDALDAEPAAERYCLEALYALAVCNHLGRREGGSAAAILSRLRGRAAGGTGIPVHARPAQAPDPCAELCNLINYLRRPGAAARSGMADHVRFALPCAGTSPPDVQRQESASHTIPEATSVPLAAKCALVLSQSSGLPNRLVILNPGRRAAA